MVMTLLWLAILIVLAAAVFAAGAAYLLGNDTDPMERIP